MATWLALALRVANPIIVWDEVAYLLGGIELARARELYQLAPEIPQYGNFLFMRVIQGVDLAGLPVEGAIKFLNVAFVSLAAGLTGWWMWGKVDRGVWLTLFLVTCFYPFGSYAGYILPEAMYAGVFAVMWVLSTRQSPSLLTGWCIFAAGAAVITMIKNHGVFLIIAWQLSTLLWAMADRRLPFRSAVRLCIASTGIYVAALFAVRGLTAPALSPSGALIGAAYQKGMADATRSWTNFIVAGSMLPGYVAAVLLLFAPTIGFLSFAILKPASSTANGPAPDLRRFQAIFLLCTLILIVGSTCLLISFEPDRIHLRYVSFLFPWMLALAAVWSHASPHLDTKAFRWTAAALWLVGTAYFTLRLHDLRPLPADAPELFFAHWSREFGPIGLGPSAPYVIAGVFGLAAALMVLSRTRWIHIQLGVLIVVLPLSIWNIAHVQSVFSRDKAPRHVGETARERCAPGDLEAVVTKRDGPWVYRTLYSVGRSTRLAVVERPQIQRAFDRAPPGRCLLTSSPVSFTQPGKLLASAAGVWLYRVGD